jgi:hypothetical protein
MRGWMLLILFGTIMLVALPGVAAEESPITSMAAAENGMVAKDDGSCHQFFDAMYVRLLAIVKDRNSSGALKRQATSNVYRDVLDEDWIAQFVAADLWVQAIDDQRTAYVIAYRAFLGDLHVGPGVIDDETMAAVTDLPLTGFRGVRTGVYEANIEIMARDNSLGEMAYYFVEPSPGTCRLRDIAFNQRSMLASQRAFINKLGAIGGLATVTEKLMTLISTPAASGT